MRCPTCNTLMTKDSFEDGAKKSIEAMIEKYFEFRDDNLYRFNLKLNEWIKVRPYFIVTLPSGKRVTWNRIERVLLGGRVTKFGCLNSQQQRLREGL